MRLYGLFQSKAIHLILEAFPMGKQVSKTTTRRNEVVWAVPIEAIHLILEDNTSNFHIQNVYVSNEVCLMFEYICDPHSLYGVGTQKCVDVNLNRQGCVDGNYSSPYECRYGWVKSLRMNGSGV